MRTKFTITAILLLLLFAADILVGSMKIDYGDIFTPDSIANRIIFDFRLPKAIVALLAGVALSVCGLMMQTIFRNPLADPYILGVSSGASLGVAIFLMGAPLLGIGFLQDMGTILSAWIGAAAILVLVMTISYRLRNIMAVLILGIMFGSAASALVGVLQFFGSEASVKGFAVWSMGSLGGLSEMQLTILAACTVAGLIMSVWAIKPLNLLLLGDNYARSMGLNIVVTRSIIFGATSLLSGSVTAFCGPIAFIGIAVPHIARMVFRSANHRVLLPASALTGGAVMLLSDLIAGMPGSSMVLPINTITSLLGIPVVILVIFNGYKNRKM